MKQNYFLNTLKKHFSPGYKGLFYVSLMKSSSGSGYDVAVVGGIRQGYIQPIEIFSVDTETWQEGWYTVKHCQRCSS